MRYAASRPTPRVKPVFNRKVAQVSNLLYRRASSLQVYPNSTQLRAQ
jgi:hypothetical protein